MATKRKQSTLSKVGTKVGKSIKKAAQSVVDTVGLGEKKNSRKKTRSHARKKTSR